MHVHVDERRVAADGERQNRVPVARHYIGIGAAHRAEQELVADRTAVDDKVDVCRRRTVKGWQADLAGQRKSFARSLDRHRVVGKVGAEHAGRAAQKAVFAWLFRRIGEGAEMVAAE
jgi:hypothetical protein